MIEVPRSGDNAPVPKLGVIAPPRAVGPAPARLSADEEPRFRTWYGQYSQATGNDPDPDAPEHHYDYRGFWQQDQGKTQLGQGMHLPDTFKLPGHPTFSDESKYFTPGMQAVHWQGNTPVPIAARPGAAQPEGDRPGSMLDAAARRERLANSRLDSMRRAAIAAMETQPDQHAQALHLAQRQKLDWRAAQAAVQTDPRRASLLQDDLPDIARRLPSLSRWLGDPHNFSVASDDIPALRAIEEAAGPSLNWFNDLRNSTGIGFLGIARAYHHLAGWFGLQDEHETARQLAINANAMDALRGWMTNEVQEHARRVQEAEGAIDTVGAFFSSPLGASASIAEQVPASLLMMATGGAGGAAMAGAGAVTMATAETMPILVRFGQAVGTYYGSKALETSSRLDEELVRRGVDLGNAGAMRAALGDPELMAQARSAAELKGIGTSAVEALSILLAGHRLVGTRTLIAKLKAGALELGEQSLGEAGGEGLGQLFAAKGDVSELDWKEMVLEAASSLGQSAIQIGTGAAWRQAAHPAIEQLHRSVRTLNDARTMRRVADAWLKSKAAQRAAPAVRQFVQDALGRAGISTTTIGIDDWNRVWTAAGESPATAGAQLFNDEGQHYFDAVSTGTLRLPEARLIEVYAGTPHLEALLPALRTVQDGPTVAAAEEHVAGVQHELEAAQAEATKLFQDRRQESEAIRDLQAERDTAAAAAPAPEARLDLESKVTTLQQGLAEQFSSAPQPALARVVAAVRGLVERLRGRQPAVDSGAAIETAPPAQLRDAADALARAGGAPATPEQLASLHASLSAIGLELSEADLAEAAEAGAGRLPVIGSMLRELADTREALAAADAAGTTLADAEHRLSEARAIERTQRAAAEAALRTESEALRDRVAGELVAARRPKRKARMMASLHVQMLGVVARREGKTLAEIEARFPIRFLHAAGMADAVAGERRRVITDRLAARPPSPAAAPIAASERVPAPDSPAEAAPATETATATSPTAALTGRATRVHTVGNTYDAHFAVVELASLVPSHVPTPRGASLVYTPDERYPASLQPRDYAAKPAEQAKVEKFALELPGKTDLFLGDTPTPTDGPPIVTTAGVVINGNGRTMALMVAAQLGTLADYRARLLEQAARFGIDPAAAGALQQPVLVRVVDLDAAGAEAHQFAREGNESLTQAQGLEDRMASLQGILPESVLRLEVPEDSTLTEVLAGDSAPARAALAKLWEALPENLRPDFFTEPGVLSTSGRQAVGELLLGAVVSRDALAEQRPSIRGMLLKAVPQLAAARADLVPSLQIQADLEAALRFGRDELLDWTQPLGQQLLGQTNPFDALPPAQQQLVRFLLANVRRDTALRSLLAEYVSYARGSTMIGVAHVEPAAALEAALDRAVKAKAIADPRTTELLQPPVPLDGDQREEQRRRGAIEFGPPGGPGQPRVFNLTFYKEADDSTFFHELGHYWLEVLGELATDPSAAGELQADYKAVLKWLGVESRADIGKEHHEQFARGFEAYLFEGKAPAPALRRMFAAFARWLAKVYTDLRALDVELSPEIRGVMDRLLASEREIDAAQAEGGVEPIFRSPADVGLTDEEFNRYTATVRSADDVARAELAVKVLKGVEHERRAERRERLEELRGQVEAELNKEPLWNLLALLQRGTMADGSPLPPHLQPTKLDARAIGEAYGIESDTFRQLEELGVLSDEGGVRPSVIADLFGFKSGGHLVESLLWSGRKERMVKIEAMRRLRRESPNLVHRPELLKREATAIVEGSEGRQAVANTELQVLQRLASRQSQELETARGRLNRAEERLQRERDARRSTLDSPADHVIARRQAQNILGTIPVAQIKPEIYLGAARRERRQVVERVAGGSYQLAADASRRELLNLLLFTEAKTMVEERDRVQRYLATRNKLAAQKALGTADPMFRQAVNGILDRFGLASDASRRDAVGLKTFLDWLDGQDEGVWLSHFITDERNRSPWQRLTFEQLEELRDAVAGIEHVASKWNRLSAGEERAQVDATAEAIATAVRSSTGKRQTSLGERSTAEMVRDAYGDYMASHRKMASLAREMDGGVDGGPTERGLVRPLTVAGAAEAERAGQASRQMRKLVKRYLRLQRGRQLVAGLEMSHLDRIMVMFNLGTEGNESRLLADPEGRFTPEVLRQVRALATANDWRFVQSVWDLIDSFWPDIKAKQERVYGIAPGKIEARALKLRTADGEELALRGGYFPLKYGDEKGHSQAVADQAKAMMRGAVGSATTARGFTQERKQYVSRPLRLDIGVIFGHLSEVIHDLTHHEALIQVNRVLRDKRVESAIVEHYGRSVYRQFKNGVRDVAAGYFGPQNMVERSLEYVRVGTVASALGFNLSTAVVNVSGLTQSMVRVGPGYVSRAMGRLLRDPRPRALAHWVEIVHGKSQVMRTRGLTMQRELAEARSAVRKAKGGALSWAEESSFWFLEKTQLLVDMPTWLGAYDRGVAETGDEAEAIARADQAVLDSQGGGQVKDLAGIQRGGAWLKAWTTLYGYANTTYNLSAERTTRRAFSSPAAFAKWFVDMLLLWSVPVALSYGLHEAFRMSAGGKGKDEDDIVDELVTAQATYLLGSLVFVRELGDPLEGYTWRGPAGARLFAELDGLIQQLRQDEVDDALRRKIASVIGILLHGPGEQAVRTFNGAWALAHRKARSPMVLVTGPPRR